MESWSGIRKKRIRGVQVRSKEEKKTSRAVLYGRKMKSRSA